MSFNRHMYTVLFAGIPVIGKTVCSEFIKKFLQKYFKLNPAPAIEDRILIAEKLQVPFNDISLWFRNKRLTIKRKSGIAPLKKGEHHFNAFTLKSQDDAHTHARTHTHTHTHIYVYIYVVDLN